MSDRDEVEQRIEHGIRRLIARAVFVNDGVGRQLGLRPIDVQVLNLLLLADTPITAGAVTTMAGLPSSTTTRVLDRLENAGYLRRVPDPEDRRRIVLELDRDRCAEYETRFDALRRANQARTAHYTRDELELIARFLGEHIADPAADGTLRSGHRDR
ncbi:MarR family winged helix-turn-helix transcriptional regulator [Nocardia brasiliensis]|uniref:MarR family winged helix-turn-helix transcriptional regulator n=1 Tax=Nocardia brasiliensis TaxID=37326 RepID=UPI002454061F|nr:MarR family transcriptional regulator [Nocardia brasiliensis]